MLSAYWLTTVANVSFWRSVGVIHTSIRRPTPVALCRHVGGDIFGDAVGFVGDVVMAYGGLDDHIRHRAPNVQRSSPFSAVIVLNGGRIAEEGTHAELSANDGLYKRPYLAQNVDPRLTSAPSKAAAAPRDS